MSLSTKKTFIEVEKFQHSEQMWFWFLHSKQIKNGFSRNNFSSGRRACEMLDIETLITRLYLSGRITDNQLSVMKEFGDKRRSPHQHIWAENKKAALWRDAMQTIETAAVKKGWI